MSFPNPSMEYRKYPNIHKHLNFELREQTYLNIREMSEWYLILLVPYLLLVSMQRLFLPQGLEVWNYLTLIVLIFGTLIIFVSNLTFIQRVTLHKLSDPVLDHSVVYWTLLEAILTGITGWFSTQFNFINVILVFVILLISASVFSSIYIYVWQKQRYSLKEDFLWAIKATENSEINPTLQRIHNVDKNGLPTETKELQQLKWVGVVIRLSVAPLVLSILWYLLTF
jgi:hypothetical protein